MQRLTLRLVLPAAGLSLAALAAAPQESDAPVRGPFGLTRLETSGRGRPETGDFQMSQDCALCHVRQWNELKGSMHSVAHEDPLYRAFAELAREEAGEEVYTYCSGCHTPAGVVMGLIPTTPEQLLPPIARAGVTCDVCHQVGELTGADGPWGEPGNASFALNPSAQKIGPHGDLAENPAHTSVRSEDLSSSEFCASCHTVIHPFNGLRIEHTYAEWKESVYAEKGIQCQDCHMRSPEDARRVAETLEPVEVLGTLVRDGEERAISPHLFVGGNVDARRLGGGGRHASIAERRLRSAATLEVRAPAQVAPGAGLELVLVVTNVGAGHNLPTSLTELREMWIHVRVEDAAGRVVFESGDLDEHGEIREGAVRFGAGLVDAEGQPTFRPWEAVDFAWKRLVPPKGAVEETLRTELPADLRGPLQVRARLLYRIAPPHVVHEVMGEDAFEPSIVEMATAAATVPLQP